MADIVKVIESFLHDVDHGEVEFDELNNVVGYNELKQLVHLAKQAHKLAVGETIKIVKTIENPVDGKLPDEIIGQVVEIEELIDNEIWVEFKGNTLLILEGEYEII